MEAPLGSKGAASAALDVSSDSGFTFFAKIGYTLDEDDAGVFLFFDSDMHLTLEDDEFSAE